MGKRRKRLTMAKYGKKYASVRATIARLQGVVEEAEADGIITPEEAEKIEEAKQEVVEEIVGHAPIEGVHTPEDINAVAEEAAEEAAKIVKEVKEVAKKTAKAAKPKKKIAPKKRTTKKEASSKG